MTMPPTDIEHLQWLMGLLQRPAALEILAALSRRPHSTDELIEAADAGTATVDQTLAVLVEEGFARRVPDEAPATYQITPRGDALVRQLVALADDLHPHCPDADNTLRR